MIRNEADRLIGPFDGFHRSPDMRVKITKGGCGMSIIGVETGRLPQMGFGTFKLPVHQVGDTRAAYAGPALLFGTATDPMVGQRVGGTITFGGGLGLYNGTNGIGGLGLSGDTACADHSTAWRVRDLLNLQPAADGLGLDRIHLDNLAGH